MAEYPYRPTGQLVTKETQLQIIGVIPLQADDYQSPTIAKNRLKEWKIKPPPVRRNKLRAGGGKWGR